MNVSLGSAHEYCEVCDRETYHMRYMGETINFLECLVCGNSKVEHKKEELKQAHTN